MKKLFLFSCVAAIAVLLAGFVINRTTVSHAPSPAGIPCAATPATITATAFIPPAPTVVMVRKNIYSLSAAEITALKTGISAMKALPLTNPTSWQYQAAIHGTTLANNLASWNSCQHGTLYFLSWHRMYLYFFERILRAKSGSPALTLPYWNYQTNPALPPDYRNSAAGNTLYDGSRNASINAGGALGAGIMTAINNSLTNIPFYDFQGDLEGPHGSVHVSIGGNMGAVNKAALDPCFWLHHANIDRLWEVWMRKCGGRSNPTDATWLNHQFTFFDETGKAVVMTGSQVVHTASQLNYRYDFPLMLPCNFVIKWWEWKWKWWELLRIPVKINLREKLQRISFKQSKPDNLERFIRETKTQRFNFSDKSIPDKLFITLEGVQVNKMPEGSIEVYVNLPAGTAADPRSKFFAGVVDLFTATGHAHQHENTPANVRINISSAARTLGLTPAALRNAEISFVVRGNTLKGREVQTTADIEIGSVVMGVEKAEK